MGDMRDRLLGPASILRRAKQLGRWRRRERLFRRFLSRIAPTPTASTETVPVAVLVQPWLLSDVPWYSILLAHGIARRNRSVLIIWDDLPWSGDDVGERMVNASIARTLESSKTGWPVFRLSDFKTSKNTVLKPELLKDLARLNTTWLFRGHSWPPEANQVRERSARHFAEVAGAFEGVLRQIRPAAVVIPGGIYSSSGVTRSVAEQLGIRVATYDSGEGVLLTSCNGVAAWLDDIPRAFSEIGSGDDTWIGEAAERELRGRCGVPGERSVFGSTYQAVATQVAAAGGEVLLPLNQSYDTAALGRHRVFSNQVEWMIETVKWVLGETEATVVVRRHPVERFAGMRSTDEYGDTLHAHFGESPRLRYVSEGAAVSTYELFSEARVVVPYTSTVGVEATMVGVPVVTESASYYADLGFVWPAATESDYFALLRRALAGQLVVDEARRTAARRVYYLTQLCNFLFTDVTPMPGDFEKWVRRWPDEVLATPEFSDVVKALVDDIPLAVLRHRRRALAHSAVSGGGTVRCPQ